LWTAVDTVARGFALGKLNSFIATWIVLVVAMTPFLRRVATFLGTDASKNNSGGRHSSPFASAAFRAGIIGFPIAGLLLVLLDGTVHWLFNQRCAWGCA